MRGRVCTCMLFIGGSRGDYYRESYSSHIQRHVWTWMHTQQHRQQHRGMRLYQYTERYREREIDTHTHTHTHTRTDIFTHTDWAVNYYSHPWMRLVDGKLLIYSLTTSSWLSYPFTAWCIQCICMEIISFYPARWKLMKVDESGWLPYCTAHKRVRELGKYVKSTHILNVRLNVILKEQPRTRTKRGQWTKYWVFCFLLFLLNNFKWNSSFGVWNSRQFNLLLSLVPSFSLFLDWLAAKNSACSKNKTTNLA